MKTTITFLVFIALLYSGCKETIIEQQIPKEFTNDLLHADLVGKIVPANSKAIVTVSQVNPINSVEISPVDGSFAFRDLRAGNYDVTIRAENYRVYYRANVILTGGTINYLGEINLSTVPDLVDQFYPEDKSEIVYDWRYGRITVSILFTHPMDRESVEKAFSTNPPAEGIFYWGNYTKAPMDGWFATAEGGFDRSATITTFSKITSVTYSFAQKDSYTDTTYKVTLSTVAMDTSGNHLRFPLHFKFSTVQSYSTQNGIQTSPVNGDINISPLNYNSINVTFPRRMDKSSVERLTSVSPQMNTIFLWPDENILSIYTGGPLLSDTTISVAIDNLAKDKDGNILGHTFKFSFRTAALGITNTYPSNGQLFVSLSEPIQIYFNNYVTLSSSQAAISISPAVIGSISYGGYYPNEQLNLINFTPSTSLKPNTKYTVTISAEIKDMHGKNMKTPYSFSFVTRLN